MQWLNNVVDVLVKRHHDGEVLIESGGSPSGTYHLGHMRELVICDSILLELKRRGLREEPPLDSSYSTRIDQAPRSRA